jgi:predicted ATPase/DNA-binding CsgD family transcriptional regulator/DNA-binding XRE family transcriptional regulator
MIDLDTTFGQWLKQLRTALDLTQEQCAERVGCAVETIGAIETGRRRPSRAMAERLADVLAVPPGRRAAFLRLARTSPERSPEPADEAPLAAASLRPRSLPAPAAPLIGRASEQEELRRRLADPACRILSLVGPGGIGKTRLALQLASDIEAGLAGGADAFADGVAVALLAPVASARDVPLAILEAAGYIAQGARPIEDQLIDLLRDRRLLLVLDNLEHLLGPGEGEALAALLRRVLSEAPGVRLLATSRERLRLRDERALSLHGLTLPHSASRAAIDASAAVLLFLERAQRVESAFALTPANRAAVSEICHLLDGVPLAIELAASWVHTLSPPEIAAEVRRGMDFLVGTHRDADARHQSMRVVFEQSWRLLSEDERLALARLSVFQGGCERDAAALVAEAGLPLLTALIDKSLVRREQQGAATRYTLHELVRQYAAERLAADPADQLATEGRHTACYAELLERSIATHTGGSSPETWADLMRNIDNLRAAWMRAATTGDSATVRRMARSLMLLYDVQGLFGEATAAFARAADALRAWAPASDIARGLLMGIQGYFMILSRPSASVQLLEQGIALLEAAGDSAERAHLQLHLGTAELARARFSVAQEHYALAIRLAAEDDEFTRLWATQIGGSAATFTGDLDLAERNYRICLDAWRGHGFSRGISTALSSLSEVALRRGRLDEAEALGSESVQVSSAARDVPALGRALRELGALALERGDLQEAHYLLTESCEGLRTSGEQWTYGRSRSLLVRSDLRRGELASARQGCAELLAIVRGGALIVLREAAYGLALLLLAQGNDVEALALLLALDDTPGEHATLIEAARTRDRLERRLDPAQRAAAERARRRPLLPWLEEICARPLAPAVSPAEPTPAAPAGGLTTGATGEILSAREVEVLRLLIGGASNQAIADTLVISPHTAKHHVASILGKLGAATRTAAALQGRALGLEPLPPR